MNKQQIQTHLPQPLQAGSVLRPSFNTKAVTLSLHLHRVAFKWLFID